MKFNAYIQPENVELRVIDNHPFRRTCRNQQKTSLEAHDGPQGKQSHGRKNDKGR